MRLVAIVNKAIEVGPAMNAVLHLGAGMMNGLSQDKRDLLAFIDYRDADDQLYPNISSRSFIILRGKNSEIKRARTEALSLGLPCVSFLETMTGETYVEQMARTAATSSEATTYLGVAFLGTKEILAPITKRLSLWK